MADRVVLAVGTKKGLFVAEGSRTRKRFDLRGPFGPGRGAGPTRPGEPGPASESASSPSTAATAAAATGPCRSSRGAAPERSTMVDAEPCGDWPPSR